MLKLNADEPNLNVDTADKPHESADHVGIADSHRYFDLMNLIDTTKKKIDYNKMVFTSEIDGVAKRRKSLKNHFTYNLVFLICLLVFDSQYAWLMGSGASIMLQAAETWIAIGALIVATIYMIARVIRAFLIYWINTMSGFMEDYLIKHDIHTMIEEEAYCRTVLRQILDYEKTINRISKKIETESDIQTAMDEISLMNFDIKEYHYNAGRSNK